MVRYSALVGGIGYGILHRRTLQAKADVKAAHAEYKHKEQLIQKAKEAYKNKLVAKQSDSGSEYTRAATTTTTMIQAEQLAVQCISQRMTLDRSWVGPQAKNSGNLGNSMLADHAVLVTSAVARHVLRKQRWP